MLLKFKHEKKRKPFRFSLIKLKVSPNTYYTISTKRFTPYDVNPSPTYSCVTLKLAIFQFKNKSVSSIYKYFNYTEVLLLQSIAANLI